MANLIRNDRVVLVVIFIAWVNITITYAALLDNADTPFPWLVCFLFGLSAILVGAFLIWPESRRLYVFAGAMSSVAIAARAMSIGARALDGRDDAWFLNLSQISVAVVLLLLFWWFWQHRVSAWHRREMT